MFGDLRQKQRKRTVNFKQCAASVFILFATLLIVAGYILTLLTGTRGKLYVGEGERLEDIRTYTEDGTNLIRFIDNPSDYTFTPLESDSSRNPATTSSYIVNHDPYGKPLVFVGYAILAVTLIIKLRKISWKVIGCAFLLAVLYFSLRYLLKEIPPMLRSPWLFAHVTTIMTAYSLFVIMAINPKRNILQWGVTLLCLGIILGSIWADTAWASYWSWDPKETWALITLIIYSIPLAASLKSSPEGKDSHTLTNVFEGRLYFILALISVIITYFGVNYFFGGMHSYA